MAATFIPHPQIAPCKSIYDADLLELRKTLGLSHKLMGDDIQQLVKHPDFKWPCGFYRHNYEQIFRDIAGGEDCDREARAKGAQRMLILNDLFYILVWVMGIEKANHPFIVSQCRMMEEGPQSDTLDIWARFHFKAIDLNEPVMTTKGWKNHGKLVPGDRVFHPDGHSVKVVAKTPVYTDAPCRKVTFTDGYSVICSGQHLWRTINKIRRRLPNTEVRRREFEPEIKDTFSLRPGDDVGVIKPLEFPEADLPIPPYTFGAWLGDGTSSGGRLTNGYHDVELLGYIRAEGVAVAEVKSTNGGSGSYSLDVGVQGQRGTGMTSILREMGVKNNKHIPQVYMQSSVSQRMEMLRGLMDTDGYSDGRGTATFVNKSETLADDVYDLAASLGFRPRKRKHSMNLPDGRPYPFFHVSFQVYQDNAPFKLSRKVAKCSDRVRFGSLRRLVKSVEEVEPIPVSCIQVDSPDGLYLVGRQLVPTHNSTIITIAETLQYHLKYPEECTGILGYARPVAKKFLRAIKNLCEQSLLLKWAFSDVLWQNPMSEAPKWSEDDGIVFKRKSASRGESTIEAWGLTEGAPTGRHFERLIFDDIETEDIAGSAKMMTDVFSKFQMNVYNLGTGSDKDKRRVIGTYYSHIGPIKQVENMKFGDTKDETGIVPGKPMWTLRICPATDDGTINGTPVMLDPDSWNRIKCTKHVNSQQLCNPTPSTDILLDKSMLNRIDPEFLRTGKWADRFKFMCIDQAGGTDTNISGPGDLWAIMIISIVPSASLANRNGGVEATDDDLGISDVCIEDCVADQMTHSMAVDTIVRMYLKHGMIMQLGVEKVGLSTTEVHIADALAAKGRKLSVQHGNLVLLRPAGRKLENRISSALEWPLNNGKLYYSTGIDPVYVEKIKQEMDQFGFGHSDILNTAAYGYDMFKVFPFHRYAKRKVQSVTSLMAQSGSGQRVRGEWG